MDQLTPVARGSPGYGLLRNARCSGTAGRLLETQMTEQLVMFQADKDPKEWGAYYTADFVAEFLVDWAVREPTDHVMDPGFGEGVFLRAACERLEALGGSAEEQVCGVELDEHAHATGLDVLQRKFRLNRDSFPRCDFFELAPGHFSVEALVGNPPFIRYQRFSGSGRKRALLRARSQGVPLSALTSSWAPFLVHAASMVKRGGRLAMVVPFELMHAAYARPVLRHLATSFGKLIFLTFRQKVFNHLNEDTLLLLAEEKGRDITQLLRRDLANPEDLRGLLDRGYSEISHHSIPLDHDAICEGRTRLIEYFIPDSVRYLYGELKASAEVVKAGDLANIGIGYVTGANDFFHLSPTEVRHWGIPEKFLRPALRRSRILSGLSFTRQDWEAGLASKETGYLLYVDRKGPLPSSVRQYLTEGNRLGVSAAYKCRTRSPWYTVPHVHRPDGFLTYMSGAVPKLVANVAGVVAPNSLHLVRIRSGCEITGKQIAGLWQNSLSALSAEIEGHPLGGGMLKLEPGEARKVLLPAMHDHGLAGFEEELDRICRKQGIAEVRKRADEVILRGWLGLSARECELLQLGLRTLLERRSRKGRRSGYVS